ncbi:Uncharacterised protein [Sphingobacterium spiritivorum]|uniref:HTH cro/C1-type domain-containing protein n=1 Tax=Sphingobacterium spiritivorum TaxID=258 RepID=A0A380CQC1_SPHSI|nr:helix-turn-helix domain-containing protein [Sphingobacterium spiritivorum]SUJ26510.1 Uncharacterised protein [Sphingobacterium spiritivorum]
MGLKKAKERDYARVLFVSENLSQKELAERVGVTEKTVSKWIDEGEWRKLKRSLLNTRHNQLNMLYDQLEWLNNHIATRKVIYDIPDYLLIPQKKELPDGTVIEEYTQFDETNYPVKIGNVATSKEADSLLKLSASINRLEVETSIGETVEVAQAVIEFIRQNNLDDAKKMTAWFDLFIQSKLK